MYVTPTYYFNVEKYEKIYGIKTIVIYYFSDLYHGYYDNIKEGYIDIEIIFNNLIGTTTGYVSKSIRENGEVNSFHWSKSQHKTIINKLVEKGFTIIVLKNNIVIESYEPGINIEKYDDDNIVYI